jgi:hypothetical protein
MPIAGVALFLARVRDRPPAPGAPATNLQTEVS